MKHKGICKKISKSKIDRHCLRMYVYRSSDKKKHKLYILIGFYCKTKYRLLHSFKCVLTRVQMTFTIKVDLKVHKWIQNAFIISLRIYSANIFTPGVERI